MALPPSSTSATPSSSFQKRGSGAAGAALKVLGTKPSAHGLNLLASTGIPALDSLLGGGLPLGSVVLLLDENEAEEDEEDGLVDYTKLLQKYFLAEGLAAGNGLFSASCGHQGSTNFLHSLPDVASSKATAADDQSQQQQQQHVAGDHLKIAWRYSDKKQPGVSPAESGGGGRFDLNRAASRDRLDAVPWHDWTPDEPCLDDSHCDRYRELFRRLRDVLSDSKFSTNPQVKEKNLLRISLLDAGSILWNGDGASSLTHFLLALRSLLRANVGICMLSLKKSLQTAAGLADISECCDYVLGLRAFDRKTKSSGLFKQHHGFISFRKFSGFNCLQSPAAPPSRCVFRSTRTKFVIEQIRLPPDIGEEPGPAAAAAGGTASRIDF